MYDLFLSYLPAAIDQHVCVSKSHLLTYLGNEFGKLMTSFCHHRKTGTIFHRSGADPYMLLSNAFANQPQDIKDNTSQVLSNSVHCLIDRLTSDSNPSLLLDVDYFFDTVNELKGRKAALVS